MVGRDAELDVLRSVFQRVAADRRPLLVTIYGDAGVGKSRLTREFLEWTDGLPTPPVVLRGRCLPYGDGITSTYQTTRCSRNGQTAGDGGYVRLPFGGTNARMVTWSS